MKRYDIAIIGTGPAGVSAAITSKIRNKEIILLGSADLSDKLSKAHQIDNYPGLPAISGEEFGQRLKDHLDELGIEITDKRVNAVYSMGEYFTVQADEDMIEAATVIVAAGVMQGRPLPGEEEFLGRGVSYCATCDGRLYKGKKAAVLGYSSDAGEEAEYLAEIGVDVLFFPIGAGVSLPAESERLKLVKETPKAITGDMKARALETSEHIYDTDCVFVLRDAVAPGNLVPGIETEGAHIRVNLAMETNIAGLYACGDIAGQPYQYVKAAGQGNIAALSAVQYLNKKKA